MSQSSVRVFEKQTLLDGHPARVECIEINSQTFSVTRGLVTTVSLEDEWYDDVLDPTAVIAELSDNRDLKADVFTFWQRLPHLQPKYPYHQEWEAIAALPITSYKSWWDTQIKSRVRNLVRKAEKDGVVVREVSYNDEFVRGMAKIFNEAAIRQGRPFWHYGKDVETIRHQFSRFVHREHMIAAYLGEEMIGFVMLGNAGVFGITGQIISSLNHRDKAVTNALIAKSVEVCERLGLRYLVYLFWSDDSLSEFKRRCGFERTLAPRYFVPLTTAGRVAIATGLHRGLRAALPVGFKTPLKRARTAWYEWRERREQSTRS
jgi:hypothetical protein